MREQIESVVLTWVESFWGSAGFDEGSDNHVRLRNAVVDLARTLHAERDPELCDALVKKPARGVYYTQSTYNYELYYLAVEGADCCDIVVGIGDGSGRYDVPIVSFDVDVLLHKCESGEHSLTQ